MIGGIQLNTRGFTTRVMMWRAVTVSPYAWDRRGQPGGAHAARFGGGAAAGAHVGRAPVAARGRAYTSTFRLHVTIFRGIRWVDCVGSVTKRLRLR
jgi:hypothetical protein